MFQKQIKHLQEALSNNFDNEMKYNQILFQNQLIQQEHKNHLQQEKLQIQSNLSDKGRCGNIDRLTLQAATFDEKNNRVKLRTISADGSHATIEDQTF